MGTLIAWVLVRDELPGPARVDTLIDLPFALPTIVAGLVLLTLYGPEQPARARPRLHPRRRRRGAAVRDAAVRRAHRAAGAARARPRDGAGGGVARRQPGRPSSGGSSCRTWCRRWLAGTALAFARAISEFGSTVLISGNLPFKTQVASVHIFSQIESDNVDRRRRGVDRAAARVAGRARAPRPAPALGGPPWLAWRSPRACASPSASSTCRSCSSCRSASSSGARSRTASGRSSTRSRPADALHAFQITVRRGVLGGRRQHDLRRDRRAPAGAARLPGQARRSTR